MPQVHLLQTNSRKPTNNATGTWRREHQKHIHFFQKHRLSKTQKAELFKTHLFNTFQPHENIVNHVTVNSVNQFLDTHLPLSTPVKRFSPNDVKYILQKYPNRKSWGYDLITAEVARHLPKKAIINLTYIYNAILRLSYFLTVWKFSSIVLFPKPNKPSDLVTYYMPISLLPLFAKILEKLVLKRKLPSISENKILLDHQFGFRQSHSTIHQAHKIVDAISFSLEKKCIAPVFSLIFRKRLIKYGEMAYFSN